MSTGTPSIFEFSHIQLQYKYSLDHFKTPETILLILEQDSVVGTNVLDLKEN